jgi:hypothetical protein
VEDTDLVPIQIISVNVVKKAVGCFIDQLQDVFCNVVFCGVSKTVFFDLGINKEKDMVIERRELQISVLLHDPSIQSILCMELFAINNGRVSSISAMTCSTTTGSIQVLNLVSDIIVSPNNRLVVVVRCGEKDNVGDLKIKNYYE